MEAAFQVWAGAAEVDPDLAELSRCFLLREKVFHCVEFERPNITDMMRLSLELSPHGRENMDWLLDDPTFTSYRDYDSGFRKETSSVDKVAVSTGAILIGSGDVSHRARPAESVSRVLEALGDNPQGTRISLCRLYYHRKLMGPIRKILAGLKPAGH